MRNHAMTALTGAARRPCAPEEFEQAAASGMPIDTLKHLAGKG